MKRASEQALFRRPRAPRRARGALAALLALSTACAVAAVATRGQQPGPDGQVGEDVTPPPVKIVPASDRAQLSQSKDKKARVKLTLQLLEARLTSAATFTASEKFEDAADELGVYQALIQDVIDFLKPDAAKSRDQFKKLELVLRAHMPRIETIRRLTPSEDAVHVRACIEFVRNARTQALESFYSDTVLRGAPAKRGDDGRAKSTPPGGTPEKKPDQF